MRDPEPRLVVLGKDENWGSLAEAGLEVAAACCPARHSKKCQREAESCQLSGSLLQSHSVRMPGQNIYLMPHMN